MLMPGINLENERCWREGRTRRGAEVEAGRTRTEQDVRKPTITGAGEEEYEEEQDEKLSRTRRDQNKKGVGQEGRNNHRSRERRKSR